jgi:NADH dehydrogenase/NADH:ubiquinone oxidoreductase subunit G
MPWSSPLGETRPAWKVLRVLANLLGVPGFDFESSQDVLVQARGAQDAGQTHVAAGKLDNTTTRPDQPGPQALRPCRHPSTSWTASCAARRRCS